MACPTVSVEPPENVPLLRRVAARLDRFDWLVFTSARAVEALVMAGAEYPGKGRPRIAVVGAATARAVSEIGWPIDFVPAAARGATLARELTRGHVRPGHLVLLPRSDRALRDLPAILKRAAVELVEVEAYRTLPRRLSAGELEALGHIDAFLLASPSAVCGLVGGVAPAALRKLHPKAGFVAIGPTTAAALRANGLPVTAEAPRSSFAALVRAALDACRGG